MKWIVIALAALTVGCAMPGETRQEYSERMFRLSDALNQASQIGESRATTRCRWVGQQFVCKTY